MEGHHLHHHHRQQQQQHHHQQQQHHHPHNITTSANVDATDRFPQWSIQETKEFLVIRAELDQTFMETKRNKHALGSHLQPDEGKGLP
ncbi:Trihelix transcription factor GT-3b [Spatholobus suberectus]|nr:Trihelix transcription factor GT-3b [Spatholobus suberectus]